MTPRKKRKVIIKEPEAEKRYYVRKIKKGPEYKLVNNIMKKKTTRCRIT